ncbi:hypothetical protein [Snuella sedimenti]|uniref:Uncharacterized protein n=1 Tax=Snuella sedimenti TaxID=2798802 RepID=A0A8J7JBR6_9FLAO|nr:hypothetical protein [Snuella sedimenti]MBJ6368194.1 hypothetical protein [Snuella sedimenti]
MVAIKNISFSSLIILAVFSCISAQKLQDRMPMAIGDVYYEPWISGVKSGGKGGNLYIPVLSNPKDIILDSVFFRGKQAKLEFVDESLFVGRFKTSLNQEQDIIMSNKPYAEYGNKAPVRPKKMPFELKDNTCIVSYKYGNKTHYFKIEGIAEKEVQIYRGSRTKKQ